MDNLLMLLLNLLFENPVIAIVLLAVLSFLFRGSRSNPRQQPGRGPVRGGSMPPFGGGGPIPPPMRPVRPARPPAPNSPQGGSYAPARPTAAAGRRPAPAWAPEPPAAEAESFQSAMPVQEERMPAANDDRPAKQAAEAAPVRRRAAQPADSPVAGLHARNAAQGMIWSEVFGPPRALRLHRTHSNRRR